MDPLHVVLEPLAKEHASTLDNLTQLYAYDFSDQVPLDLNSSGRFDISFGDDWWANAGHAAFIIRVNGKLAGFALARKGSRVSGADDVMDVAEFFVARAFRGKKVGTTAAHALFNAFPGKWEVRVLKTHAAALRFWSHAIASFLGRSIDGRDIVLEGKPRTLFAFDRSP